MYSWEIVGGVKGGDGGRLRCAVSAALSASVAFLSRSICSFI